MKAMILAAGLGTRLQPITHSKPKALVEVKGVPLIERVLQRLIAAGVGEVIINLHHFPEQIKTFLKWKKNFGLRIEFSEEDELLDTGGGLKQAQWFFDDGQPFLLHNVDVLHDIDLRRMMHRHQESDCLATLAVNSRETQRYLIFDETNRLCGWKSLIQEKEIMACAPRGTTIDLAFCGIHVVSHEIFPKLREKGPFSIIDSYLRLAGEDELIAAFRVDDFAWRDVGKLEELS